MPHVLFYSVEQFFAAGQNDLRGLPVVENSQHNAREQQKQSEHHADVHVQRKSTFLRVQWAGHRGVSPLS
ncbi:hypothetical protein D3C81_2248170 [compost metagenome]